MTNNSSNNRIIWIDWCKFIAITLVVWGHISPVFRNFIFLFHMPLFFMISGYLYKKRSVKKEVMVVIWSLLLPYLIYNFIYILPLPLGGGYQKGFITNILLGNQEALCYLMVPLWFLVALMGMRVLAAFNTLNRYSLFLFLLISYVLFDFIKIDQTNDYFQLKTMCLCFPFFIVGYIIKKRDYFKIIKKYNTTLLTFSAITIFVIAAIIGLWNSKIHENGINVYHCRIGTNIVLFYISAIGLSAALMSLCAMHLNITSPIVEKLSNGTLLILATHLIIYWKIPTLPVPEIIQSMLNIIIILIVSYGLIVFCEKYCPVLMGKKK